MLLDIVGFILTFILIVLVFDTLVLIIPDWLRECRNRYRNEYHYWDELDDDDDL